MKKVIVLILVSGFAFSFSSMAQERGQCREEVQNLGCGHPREVGREEFHACVESNISKLSTECQERHQQMKERKGQRRGGRRGGMRGN